MATTTGMKGGGFYDANSNAQRATIDAFLPWLEEVVPQLAERTNEKQTFNILDIGSSEGGNAVYAMNRLIDQYRNTSDTPVQALFSDLPTNNFNQLAANLFPEGKPALSQQKVYPASLAGTAFGRLVPSNSLEVCTTFNTLGFLERKPDAPLPHFILPMGPSPFAPRMNVSVTPEERMPYQQQAARDMHAFYCARADELVSGGKLLVQIYGRGDKYACHWGLYDVLNDALLDCVDEGIVSYIYYQELVLPIYFRSVQELIEPIEQDATLAKMFRVEKAESQIVPAPLIERHAETGDRAGWARSYTNFMRAFTEPLVAAGLPDSPVKTDTVNEIYRRVEQHLLTEPERYEFHNVSVAALLTRI